MSKIAVIGIAGESVFLSVDGFGRTGETTVARSFHSELGGKGFNQAVAIARYGVEVSFLCACYQGDVERFTNIAEQNGIKSFFVGKEERSPYAVITTDKNGDNRVCVYRGAELDKVPNTTDELYTLMLRLDADGKTPFITFQNGGYWFTIFNTWLAQYRGLDYYYNTLLKLEDGEGNPSKDKAQLRFGKTLILRGRKIAHV